MNLIHRFEDYLYETLNISVKAEKWAESRRLPIYLNDLYLFYEINILNVLGLLMVAKDENEQTPATVKKHISTVQNNWNGEVIYIHPKVTAFNRKRLIEQKVSFAIPGNQLYLPFLGIDLREHYRQIKESRKTLSPSTQAVILYVLNNRINQLLTPSILANRLKYTVMTLSRAFDEIESADLGKVMIDGRERVLSFELSKSELWDKALELLISPVRKRTWIIDDDYQRYGVTAGLSGLSVYSNLAQPSVPIVAFSKEEWKLNINRRDLIERPQKEPGSVEIEVWSYSPRLFSQNNVVDKYSLYLSLRDNKDERVQKALEQMMERIEW
ncbi:MAG TPA: hypothetical protein DHW42_02560 [Candidatus Marinimicrobia bacterium]|nr:hypothetical protein [Candidatus Neomarinimicrobiota bacterium]